MDYIAHQASQSLEFSRQEYWSGLLFLSPGDLPVISSQMFLFGPTGPFIELQTQGTLQRVLVSFPLLMAAPSPGMLSSLLLICPNSAPVYLLYKVLPRHPNLK